MWAGNSAILVGRSGGLVYWAHSLFRRAGLDVAENTVEEMAIFHVFGLAGNECLFRAFLWMAEHEGRWGAVDGWLDRALAARVVTRARGRDFGRLGRARGTCEVARQCALGRAGEIKTRCGL